MTVSYYYCLFIDETRFYEQICIIIGSLKHRLKVETREC